MITAADAEPARMPPVTPIAPGEIRVVQHRRVWLATAMDALSCPDGHRLKDPLIWEHGCLRCKHRATARGAECGKLVYLLGGGLVTLHGDPLIVLAEVTPTEMRMMATARMDYGQAIAYLGIIFKP